MENINYYEILEVSEDASLEVIKASYRALAKKYHPDTCNQNNVDKRKNMALINEAYETLSDESKRRQYDQNLKIQRNNVCDSSEYEKQYYAEKSDFSNPCNDDTCYKQSNGDSEENPYEYYDKSEDCYEEDEDDGGWFAKLFRGISREVLRTVQNNNREIENAYFEGLSLDDYTLVRRFKYSKGNKRAGYVKALESKQLLERDYDGKLIPSYRFKQLF